MKKSIFLSLAMVLFAGGQCLHAQGTTFTYQGRLQNNGSPASGNYDFTFALFNTNSTSGSPIGGARAETNVGVTNGLFTVPLDFGNVFTGQATWLSIGVRTNGGATYSTLGPLQELTPTPYALYAGSVAGSNIVGSLAAGQLPANVITNGENGVSLTGLQGLWSQSGTILYDLLGSVGIGTTTPAATLEVNGSAQIDGTANLNALANFSGGINLNSTAGYHQTSVGTFYIDAPDYVGGRFTVTSGGNVGIGVSAPANKLVVGGIAEFIANVGLGTGTPANQLEVAGTAQFDGKVGIGTSVPANPLEVVGTAQFDGSVGIGTSTPAAPLQVVTGSFPAALISSSSAYGTWSEIQNTSTGGTNWAIISTGTDNGYAPGTLLFDCASGPGSTTANVLTLQSDGNVGIGTGTPANKLEVAGTAQIDGYLGIGTSSPTAPLHVVGSSFPTAVISSSSVLGTWSVLQNTSTGSTNWAMICTGASNGLPPGTLLFDAANAPNDTTANVLTLQPSGMVGIDTSLPGDSLDVNGAVRGAGFRCRAGYGGTVLDPYNLTHTFNFYWTGTELQAWVDSSEVTGSISDPRLKENIEPMADQALARVMALKPVSFKFKNIPGTIFTGSPDLHEGFLADQLQEVIPSAVRGQKGALTSAGKIQPQTVDVLPVVAVLTKAVQEQQREMDELKAKFGQVQAEKEALLQRVIALETRDQAREDRLARLERNLEKNPTVADCAPAGYP